MAGRCRLPRTDVCAYDAANKTPRISTAVSPRSSKLATQHDKRCPSANATEDNSNVPRLAVTPDTSPRRARSIESANSPGSFEGGLNCTEQLIDMIQQHYGLYEWEAEILSRAISTVVEASHSA